MSAFRTWYITHQDAITWFIIGICVMAGLASLVAGNYFNAVINFGIAALNYFLNKHKMKL
jgi:uncharacterized MnhB-related membrane protein